ncbi:MAG: type VI secretion system Vgr family protein [Pseudomonadota bacterium]
MFSTSNRPMRLRLGLSEGCSDSVLLPQRVTGTEAMCEGFEYRILCVAGDASLPLKDFIGIAADLQLVTDRGELHSICGIVTGASAGQSDGGLATYQLVLTDALRMLEQRTNTRVFLNKNEIDIIDILLSEWRQRDPALAAMFGFEFAFELKQRGFPQREFTMQYNESDAAFIRRLLKRRGIAWYFRAGGAAAQDEQDDELEQPPMHTLVMFDDQLQLKENTAGSVRYHRQDATEQRDTITAWCAQRALRSGSVSGFSWDYGDPLAVDFMATNSRSKVNQGPRGNRHAALLDDYRVETPHIGDDNDDHAAMASARMARHDYESKHFMAESNVRDLRIGEWISVDGHPELDAHAEEERKFIVTSLRVSARNNLPKKLDARVNRMFAHNGWDMTGPDAVTDAPPYRNTFTCVRRGVRIVPAFDPRNDVPRASLASAIVVGPEGEEIHCDQMDRVKIRFLGTREADHQHAHGAGASGTDGDSAFVRVAAHWAGPGPGSMEQLGGQFLPRVGTEVLIAFVNDDPDKPIVVGQLYNNRAMPPALSRRGDLPGNRWYSGIRSREQGGSRGNQLRFDDTSGQISAQLASDHGRSELNLGWCAEPRADGAGAPRGEGAELRSDEFIALRAAKGLLLSAWRHIEGASQPQLARDEYLALMRDCADLADALGQYAAAHQAAESDRKELQDLQASLKNWANGSNTAPKGVDGGAPMIGVSAPAGISFASAKAIVHYAATNIDNVAQHHLQLTAGQRYNVNAGKGISLFAHHEGIRAIAHYGKFLLQSQHDDTELNAAKTLKLTATEGKISGMAKVIELIAEDGSFIKIGGGSITLGSNSPLLFHAPSFVFEGATTMAAALPHFDGGDTDLKFSARYYPNADGDLPAPGLPHKISASDGSNREGKNDDAGKSELLKSDVMHSATIDIQNPKPVH